MYSANAINTKYSAEAIGEFVRAVIGLPRGFSNFTAIGFGEPLKAGVVYHNWQPEAGVIELSAGATTRNWLTKTNLRTVFDYPFEELGCQLCVARISPKNMVARRVWKALGATETVIPRLRGRHEAEVISTLTAEAWATMKERLTHGKT